MTKSVSIYTLPDKLKHLCMSLCGSDDFPKMFIYNRWRVTVWAVDLPVEIEV